MYKEETWMTLGKLQRSCMPTYLFGLTVDIDVTFREDR